MAKKSNKKVNKKDSNVNLVVNNLTIAQVNRTQEDVATWQAGLKSAESVTNPQRKRLYETYNNVLTDGFLSSLMSKRIRAIKTAPFVLSGTDNEDLIKKFKTPWFNRLLEYIMQSRFWGHSLVEFVFVDNEISDVVLIPRRHVVPEKGVIQKQVGSYAEVFHFRDEPLNSYMLEAGDKDDLGLLAKLTPYALYKRGNIADYAQFNEMFGQPIREYTYDPLNPNSRLEAEQAAKKAGAAAYIVVPKGTELKLHQSSGISASGTFKDFNRVMNEEMSITVLGQTLTTTNDGVGSNALGRVHKDVEESINLEDKIFVEYILNWDLKGLLVKHGYPLDGVEFKFDDTQRMAVKDRADVYTKLNQEFPIDPKFVYEDLKIPEPGEEVIDEWRKQKQSSQPGGAVDQEGKP